jgi:hypothetical protein
MKHDLTRRASGAVAAMMLIAAAAASPAAAAPRGSHAGSDSAPCFFISEWQGWKSPNPHTLYLGVNFHQVYEVQLSGDSDLLQDPDAHLVSVTHGPDTVCSALDLQLAVAEPFGGIKEPLIAKSLVKLTPDQVAAIPKKYLPY